MSRPRLGLTRAERQSALTHLAAAKDAAYRLLQVLNDRVSAKDIDLALLVLRKLEVLTYHVEDYPEAMFAQGPVLLTRPWTSHKHLSREVTYEQHT